MVGKTLPLPVPVYKSKFDMNKCCVELHPEHNRAYMDILHAWFADIAWWFLLS